MHVYASWAKKPRTCEGKCGRPIETGEPILATAVQAGKVYISKGAYHLDCWVSGVQQWWKANPYVPVVRGRAGRPNMHLDNATWHKRRALIAKASRIQLAKKTALDNGWVWKLEALESRMREVTHELQEVGGVPSHWGL